MPRLSPFTTNGVLSPLLAAETAKSSQARLLNLITLYIPLPNNAGVEEFNIVDSNYPVTYSHRTASGTYTTMYSAFPVKFNGTTINSDGSIDKASIVIANVSREIMFYVENNKGLQGCRVAIKTLFENVLDYIYTPNDDGTVSSATNPNANSTAYMEEEYQIDTYQASDQVVNFTLDPIIDLEIRLPRRRFMVDTCYWTYKDPHTCKFTNLAPVGMGMLLAGLNTFKAAAYAGGLWQPQAGTKFVFTNDSAQTVFTVLTTYVAGGGLSGNRNPDGSKTVAKAVAASEMTVSPMPTSTYIGPVRLFFDAGSVCEKTLAACRTRGNEANFGGFPGISGTRKVFL